LDKTANAVPWTLKKGPVFAANTRAERMLLLTEENALIIINNQTCPEDSWYKYHVNGNINLVVMMSTINNKLLSKTKDIRTHFNIIRT
jgi:hypothetical protein